MDHEEIILIGSYKHFNADKHFYVDNASEQDLSAVLVQLSNYIEPYIYEFSGIDTKKIDTLIPPVSGLPAVCAFLKTVKRDMLLPAAQGKSTMMPIAESYLLNTLFKRAGIEFKPPLSTALKPEVEKPEGLIAFIGNCKGWFAAKKMSVEKNTENWEVAGILSGINFTIVNKSFDFLKSTGSTKEGRKSLNSLADALLQVNPSNVYEICKTCEGFGIKPYAAPQMLMAQYPDIKPPKVKGRKPKG